MNPFINRHQNQITGVLSCFDRVIIPFQGRGCYGLRV